MSGHLSQGSSVVDVDKREVGLTQGRGRRRVLTSGDFRWDIWNTILTAATGKKATLPSQCQIYFVAIVIELT